MSEERKIEKSTVHPNGKILSFFVLENILSSSENTYDDSEIDSEDLFEND